jgi:5-methylcytosine-specific restriction endonuclease McrA
MPVKVAILDALVAAGASAQVVAAYVKAEYAADEAIASAKREQERDRKGKRRDECSEADWMLLRAAVFDRDNHTCVYCGSIDGPLHCDHVVPFSRGGLSVMDNLATACGACNSSKGHRLLSEWEGHHVHKQ